MTSTTSTHAPDAEEYTASTPQEEKQETPQDASTSDSAQNATNKNTRGYNMSFGKTTKCKVCGREGSSLSMTRMTDGALVCRKGKKNCKGWYIPE